MVIKKCGTCCFHQNNRYRQAPLRIMKNKQSAHTNVCRPCSCSPLRIRLREPGQNWRFCCPGNPKIHKSSIIFFRTSCPVAGFSADRTKITFLLTSQYGLPGLFYTAKVFYAHVLSKFISAQNSSNRPHGLYPAVIERKNVDLYPVSLPHRNQEKDECFRTGKDI